jgi:hypothetical protein
MSNTRELMKEYELTVEVNDNDTVSIQSGEGGSETGKIFLDPVRRKMIKVFDNLLRRGKISGDDELGLLGEILYEAIFNGEVETFFKGRLKQLDAARQANELLKEERLRVELVFREGSNAQELGKYPWEFLYYPDEGTPLATKANIVLCRHMPTRGINRENITPPEGPLKVMLVIARPDEFLPDINDEKAVEYEKNFEAIVNDILNLKNLKTSQIEILEPLKSPTVDKLAQALVELKPHIVHYIGHGRYSSAGEIALIRESCQSVHWCSSATFADCFEGVPPRLVFLHLCAGVQNDKVSADYLKANFAELAPELIQKRVQAVVAMRYPVHHVAAQKFTKNFYQALAEGRTVAAAVQIGRRFSTLSVRDSALGSPVLFMHSKDGSIFAKPSSTSRQQPASTGPIAHNASALDFSFDDLAEAGLANARLISLKEEEVKPHLALLRKEMAGKNREAAQQLLTEKIQDDPTSKLVMVYSAMSQKLKISAG